MGDVVIPAAFLVLAAALPLVATQDCEICGGKGEIVLQEPDHGQHQGRIGSTPKEKVSCPICGGKGRYERYRDPSKVQMEMMRERERLLEERGEPCVNCNWSGIEACKKCKGAGLAACGEKDCKGGWIVTKTTKVTKKSSSGGRGNYGGYRSSNRSSSKVETKINVTKCPRCKGVGQVRCQECGGRRAQACRKCGGIGIDPRAARKRKEAENARTK